MPRRRRRGQSRAQSRDTGPESIAQTTLSPSEKSPTDVIINTTPAQKSSPPTQSQDNIITVNYSENTKEKSKSSPNPCSGRSSCLAKD